MAHTKHNLLLPKPGEPLFRALLLVCVSIFPYTHLTLLSLMGLLILCLWQTYRFPGELFVVLQRSGLIVVSLLFVISALFAFDRSEASLQLAHFLPFFWIWANLVIYLRNTPNFFQEIGKWSLAVVFSGLPVSLFGIAECVIKHLYKPFPPKLTPAIDWLYTGDLWHPRTYSIFDYPNTLANYLVMILGLNIGLLFLNRETEFFQRSHRVFKLLLYINALLILICLHCSGSRNGYLVAAVLFGITLIRLRNHRWGRLLGLAGLASIIVTTLTFGIGGRTLTWSWITDDPRVGVWGLALKFIRERPLLGYGLGNYKLLYNGEVPDYDFIAHAHNLWLMLLSEAGIPVTLAFTVVIGMICYRAVRALAQLRDRPNDQAILVAYSLAFLGSVLFSLWDVTLFEVRVNLLGWLSLAVMYCSLELSLQKAQALD